MRVTAGPRRVTTKHESGRLRDTIDLQQIAALSKEGDRVFAHRLSARLCPRTRRHRLRRVFLLHLHGATAPGAEKRDTARTGRTDRRIPLATR